MIQIKNSQAGKFLMLNLPFKDNKVGIGIGNFDQKKVEKIGK